MQEEIEHKTVNLAISTTKLSARTLLRGMQFLLRQYDKHASQGKQSMKRLVRQNRGVTNVEIQKTGIKDFDRYAKRYHIDYSVADSDMAFRIHLVLHRLEEPYKEVFQLRVFGELSFSQIAAIFGKTESWARVTYHRAKLKIQERMDEKHE